MKILLISNVRINENGIATFILNCAKALSSLNDNVTILAPNIVKESIREEIQKNKINLVELPFRSKEPIKYFYKMYREIKKISMMLSM
ncbi:MAG: hypothetical protein ABF575_08070 [Liquorilactobacillus hordei]|uniref:hypothetical protein n=1 Tax=Liquorilactobacillus hordei TaxID=468911 RepID=UPI0039E9536E